MRAANSRSQRFPLRAMRHEPQTSLPTIADLAATIYRVKYHGEHTRSEILVLAADETQAKELARLRWAFLGEALEPKPTLSIDSRPAMSQEMKDAILTFESPMEFQARQHAYRAAHPEWPGPNADEPPTGSAA